MYKARRVFLSCLLLAGFTLAGCSGTPLTEQAFLEEIKGTVKICRWIDANTLVLVSEEIASDSSGEHHFQRHFYQYHLDKQAGELFYSVENQRGHASKLLQYNADKKQLLYQNYYNTYTFTPNRQGGLELSEQAQAKQSAFLYSPDGAYVAQEGTVNESEGNLLIYNRWDESRLLQEMALQGTKFIWLDEGSTVMTYRESGESVIESYNVQSGMHTVLTYGKELSYPEAGVYIDAIQPIANTNDICISYVCEEGYTVDIVDRRTGQQALRYYSEQAVYLLDDNDGEILIMEWDGTNGGYTLGKLSGREGYGQHRDIYQSGKPIVDAAFSPDGGQIVVIIQEREADCLELVCLPNG